MVNNFEQILISKDIRPTSMRILVLEFLSSHQYALSLTVLTAGMENTDRITLYRTLKTFEEKGLIHSINDGTGSTKYAVCEEYCSAHNHQDLHLHFYCNSCKETYCLPTTKIPALKLPNNYSAEEISLVVKGKCEKCTG